MQRVGCLYRVSTKRQGYNNDIPMQREACLKFIEKQKNWKFEKEYVELGVSGYKVSANDRDVLKVIKKDVLKNKIDILLVFLFDRIGRKDEETPFVVEWLIKHKIQVWSVNEGQRVIETRTDKLINYLTYWSAEGESEKISIRAYERRIQLVQEGKFIGAYAPYGYDLVDSDEITKIGKIRKVLQINVEELKIVKLIFDLIIDFNYGIDKVARYLNKHNIKRRKKDSLWDTSSVLEIVRNPIYKGYASFGKRYKRNDLNRRNKRSDWILSTKPNPDIIIVSEERWNNANNLIDSRKKEGNRKVRLLSGLTRCGYCNNSITPRGKEKYTYYICKGKDKTGYCEYTANYRVDKLEKIVNSEIEAFLNSMAKYNLKEIIKIKKIDLNNKSSKIKSINKKINTTENKIDQLKKEVVSCILSGDEAYKNSLSKKIKEENNKLLALKKDKDMVSDELVELKNSINNISEDVLEWHKIYNDADLNHKKIIANKIIDKIYLYNDKVEIQVKYPINDYIIKGYKKYG